MKKILTAIAALIAVVSCANNDTVENKMKKALIEAEGIKGYEYIEHKTSKDATLGDCLAWEKDKVVEENTKLMFSGNSPRKERNHKVYNIIAELKESNASLLENKYGEILKLKYSYKDNGEKIESSRYFVVTKEGDIIGGPYKEYQPALNEYKSFNFSHLAGYEKLRDILSE